MNKDSEVPLNQEAPPPSAPPPGYSDAIGIVPPTTVFIPVTPVIDPGLHPQPQGFGQSNYYYHPGFINWPAHRDMISLFRQEPNNPRIQNLGPQSTHVKCPSCGEEIYSKINPKPGVRAYIAGALLCAMGCCCGCCLIPCGMRQCQDLAHTCPKCDAYLGTFYKYQTL